MHDANYYKKLSDYDLEITMRRLVPSDKDHQMALEEMFRRKNEKEQDDRHTQKSIKTMTLVILIFTLATFIATIIVIFR